MISVSRGYGKELLGPPCPLLVMGVGNILLSDDGVGVHVIRTMQKMRLPDNVELLDGGTASLSFLDTLSKREKVIIVDAVQGDKNPGTIYRFTPDEVKTRRNKFTSLHQVGILETLTMFQFLGNSPKSVVIFGIEPEKLGWGMTLTPGVSAAIQNVVTLICDELKYPASNQ